MSETAPAQMTAIEEVRPQQSGFSYAGPELFPDARRYKGHELRRYVEGVLKKLASERKLRVTDILNQPRSLADIAGDVIRGIRYVDHQQIVDPFGAPSELVNYMVCVRACEKLDPDTGRPTGKYHSITWKKGMRPIEVQTRASGAYNYKLTAGGNESYMRHEDVYLRADGKAAILPLPMAYLALKQYGKHCRIEHKIENQRRYWWFEEDLDWTPDAPAVREVEAPQTRGRK